MNISPQIPSYDAHVHWTRCRRFQVPVSVRQPAEDVPPVVHVPIFVRIHLKRDLYEWQLLKVVCIAVVYGNVHRKSRTPLPHHPRKKGVIAES